MAAISPGQSFTIGYGESAAKKIQVKALSFLQKKQVTQCLETFRDSKNSLAERFESLEAAVKMCCPEVEPLLATDLDETDVIQIITGTLNKSQLSEDDQKKCEPPH